MCHETNMQAVQKCYDASELSYRKEKDGTELWGMPKKRIHSGRRVTQDVQFEAFKKIIHENLKNFLPDELITLIIDMTKYKTFIGKFGHKNVSHWTIKNKKYKKISNTFTEKDYDSIIDLENQLVIEDIIDSDNSDSTNYYSDSE